jgi:NAD(P)-dependent dehydrogenase (short-subunit alcohol dehydrogenase family)
MKTVLVIGAAGGVGLEVTRGLIGQGDTVVATVLNEAEEATLKREVGGVSQIARLNLSDAAQAGDALNILAAGLDHLDQVVVCAAISPYGPVETCSLEMVRKTLEINVVSHIAVYQATIPRLRASKGRLLFIASMSGQLAMPFLGVYTASKFALEGVADVMRQEAAAFGVDVIIVEPGGIRTGMVKQQLADVARDIAALSEVQDKMYGYMYRGFHAAATKTYNGSGSTAPQVAAVILGALNDAKPQTRYIAGDDAKQLIAARRQMSDRDFDAMIAQFFAAAARV